MYGTLKKNGFCLSQHLRDILLMGGLRARDSELCFMFSIRFFVVLLPRDRHAHYRMPVIVDNVANSTGFPQYKR